MKYSVGESGLRFMEEDVVAGFRRFMLAAVAALLVGASSIGLSAQSFPEVKPAPYQTEWQDMEFGVLLHFSTNTFLDREWGDGTADPKVFNPTQFNPDQWMDAIKASGAKYVVMVAKHHDGFVLCPPSRQSTASSPVHGRMAKAMWWEM